MDAINQKEYLKKYLGIGKAPGEKKKKKKKPSTISRVQIIDDDAEVNIPTTMTPEEILLANEDAPQIVAIIDERPPSLRVDEKTKNPLWQPIGPIDLTNTSDQKQMITSFKIEPKSNDKHFARPADRSPPRRRKPVRSDDKSPSRKSRSDSPFGNIVIKEEPQDDYSPPRRISKTPDNSPVRKRNSDMSPPRRSRGATRDKSRTPDSPVRKNRHSDDMSPPRRSGASRAKSRTPDNSPPRKRRDNDTPPPRKIERSRTPDNSPPRKHRSKKMDKTLDGKSAGLQNARELVEETRQFRTREEQLFKSLSKEVSGENAQTVLRDRKSGKIRNLEEEEEHQRKKREEEEKRKEKYTRWGRGLVQVESRDQQIKDELYEMSKPLARYADDEDLEKYLKEQEREGDPMLAYIRKKKRKKAADKGEVAKPQFEGEFMPNRYGIRPGHRWDGVDRSSGYEKKWFEVQNARKAQQEETYKWSTEDM